MACVLPCLLSFVKPSRQVLVSADLKTSDVLVRSASTNHTFDQVGSFSGWLERMSLSSVWSVRTEVSKEWAHQVSGDSNTCLHHVARACVTFFKAEQGKACLYVLVFDPKIRCTPQTTRCLCSFVVSDPQQALLCAVRSAVGGLPVSCRDYGLHIRGV